MPYDTTSIDLYSNLILVLHLATKFTYTYINKNTRTYNKLQNVVGIIHYFTSLDKFKNFGKSNISGNFEYFLMG